MTYSLKFHNISNIANRIAYHDVRRTPLCNLLKPLSSGMLNGQVPTFHSAYSSPPVLHIVGEKLTRLKSIRQLILSVRNALIGMYFLL